MWGSMGEKPVLDYRTHGAARVRRRRSPEDALWLENLLVGVFVLMLFGGSMLLTLVAYLAQHAD